MISITIFQRWHIKVFFLNEHCVVPKIIHTSPTYRRDFSLDPPPLWKFQSNFIHCSNFRAFENPSTPQGFSIPSVGEYGYYLELHNGIFFQLIMFKNIWQSKFHITSMVNGYICDMVQCFIEQKFNLSKKVKPSELPCKLQCEKIDLI